jgi:hypothetical protein
MKYVQTDGKSDAFLLATAKSDIARGDIPTTAAGVAEFSANNQAINQGNKHWPCL